MKKRIQGMLLLGMALTVVLTVRDVHTQAAEAPSDMPTDAQSSEELPDDEKLTEMQTDGGIQAEEEPGMERQTAGGPMIDARGTNLIEVTNADDFAAGSREHLVTAEAGDGALTLEEDALEGTFTSAVYETDDFDRMVASWNAALPDGCSLEVSARARLADGSWSEWFGWGTFGVTMQRTCADNKAVDTFEPGEIGCAMMCRAVLRRESVYNERPVLRGVYFTIPEAEWHVAEEAGAETVLPDRVFNPSAAYSQMIRSPRIAGDICSPTSIAVMLNSRDPSLDLLPEEVALICLDYGYGFGNWSFCASVPGLYGYTSYVRYSNLEILLEELAAGRSVAASVSYSPLQDSTYPYLQNAYDGTAGHLMVLIGYEFEEGIHDEEHLMLYAADSYAPDDASAYRQYAWSEFKACWAHSGYIGYYISETPEESQSKAAINQDGESETAVRPAGTSWVEGEADLIREDEEGCQYFRIRTIDGELDLRGFTQELRRSFGKGILMYTISAADDGAEEALTSDAAEAEDITEAFGETDILPPAFFENAYDYPDRIVTSANRHFCYSCIAPASSGALRFNAARALEEAGMDPAGAYIITFCILCSDGHNYRAIYRP